MDKSDFKYDEETIKLATINKEKFKPEKVAYVMERLEGISIIENKFEDDVLGAFFEAIVRTGFKQEKGQFFTHTNIVRFILFGLELDEWVTEAINGTSPRLLYIMDPACGSGTFLIEAVKLITHTVLDSGKGKLKKSKLVTSSVDEWFQANSTSENKNIHNVWARHFMYGIDDNEDLAMATKVNMILHGDGNANIEKADGLADFEDYHRDRTRLKKQPTNHPYKFPLNEQFDCIISNPPFSIKEDARTLAQYQIRFAYAEWKNSENLFVERWYQFLKEGGRMGVVLPDSVFDTNENLYIRMFLYRFFHIRAVVSLPVVSFQPYTPTKTSLLFAQKKTKKEVDVWDTAWRKAANEYGKVRRTDVVQYVLKNNRIRNALIELAGKADVEWYPSTSLLSAASLPADIRTQIQTASQDSPTLRRKCEATYVEFDELATVGELATIEKDKGREAAAVLKQLLRDKFPKHGGTLALSELVETAYDEIVEAADLNYTEDPKGQNYCNAWWCFAEVAGQNGIGNDIFFAEADHVGYKRTTRHPAGIPQPNDLFAADEAGHIVIDTANPKTILDALRKAHVFSR